MGTSFLEDQNRILMSNFNERIIKLYHTGALHITIGTFVTKFVVFFGSVFVVRLLSKSDYGVMSYVENIYSYAFIFAGFGLSNGILRYLVLNEDVREKKRYYNYIVRKSMMIDVVIAICLCIFAIKWRIPANYVEARYLIPIVALLLPFQDLLNEVFYGIRSFFLNKLYAYLAFGSSVILIVGRVVGAFIAGVDGVLWSRVIINVLLSIVLFLLTIRLLFPRDEVDRLIKEERKTVDVYSFQYMITNGFWAIFMLNDTFLLGLLLNDPSGLADYKVAYVLPGNISIFATAIGVFIAPYFTKNENNYDWIRKTYKKVFSLCAIIVAGVSLIIAILAEPLIILMYGEQYMNIVVMMRILLLAAFINSGLRYTTANLLAAMGQIKYNMIVSGIGIVLQILLDFILIPRMGVMAVAISNCLVYALMAIMLFAVFYKKYYIISIQRM